MQFILFSVINKLLFHIGITAFLASALKIILSLFSLPFELSIPFISGMFEITLGSKLTSQTEEANLLQQVIMTSFILAFSGFSVQAQVASILAETDIQFKPFFIARIFHGFFAAFYTVILWQPLYIRLGDSASTGAIPVGLFGEEPFWQKWLSYMIEIGPLVTIFALFIYTILVARRFVRP